MTFVVVSYLPIATPKSSGVATTTRRQAHEMAHFSTIADRLGSNRNATLKDTAKSSVGFMHPDVTQLAKGHL